MVMPAPYHADSDGDDDEASPGLNLHESQDNTVASDNFSAEPTPTASGYSHDGNMRLTPENSLLSWSTEEVAGYINEMGLSQYCEAFHDNEITGESLVALKHEELKEMGVLSVGHRLTILKSVFDTKMQHGIPIDQEDYKPPSAEASVMDQSATMADISRIIRSIEIRDHRIQAAEAELRKVTDEYRRLRDELLPVFRSHKNNSQPLPYHPNHHQSSETESDNLSPLTPTASDSKGTSLLGRKFSTKRLLLGATAPNPKATSPAYVSVDRRNMTDGSLDPLLYKPGQLSSSASPSSATIPSPTSPQYAQQQQQQQQVSQQTLQSQQPQQPKRSQLQSQPQQRQQQQQSQYRMPYREAPRAMDEDSGKSARVKAKDPTDSLRANPDINKSFRLSEDDPCEKVLPAALKKYNIEEDPKNYALYIVYGDQERCLGLREKPLILFKQLVAENRKPTFMLRQHAAPMEGHSGPTGHHDYGFTTRAHTGSIQLPGGVL